MTGKVVPALIIVFILLLVIAGGCRALQNSLVALMNESSREQATTAPVISDGLLFYGTDRGNLFARDSKTGRIKWKRKVSNNNGVQVEPPIGRLGEDTLWSAPAIDNGVIYVCSPYDMVSALDLKTGKKIWAERPGDFTGTGDTPLVTTDTVYVAGYNLAALDKTTGSLKWVFDMQRDLGAPVYADNMLYVTSNAGKVYALAASTGRVVWEQSIKDLKTEEGEASPPALGDDTVLISTPKGMLHALSLKDGKEQWRFDTGKYEGSMPSYSNGIVYMNSSTSRYAYALDGKTGKLKWRFKLGPDGSDARTLLYHGIAYFGGWDGNLYALDATTGREMWHLASGDQIDLEVAATDQMVYYRTHYTGDIYAIDVNTRRTVWSTKSVDTD